MSPHRESLERASSRPLRDAWEAHAAEFIAWARTPGHDSYWRFHRDQFLDLIPGPGRLTVDVGCGEGRLPRDLHERGHNVVGIDASPTLVAAARAASPEITFHLADAARLPLDDGAADLAIAFMSLQDVDDLAGAVNEVARVLEPGGRFCVAIVHPLNSAGRFRGEEAGSPFVIEESYLAPRHYQDVIERDGLSMTFASEHRPISVYAATLRAADLLIEQLHEHPIPDAAVTEPRQERWQRVPLFLHIRAVRMPARWGSRRGGP